MNPDVKVKWLAALRSGDYRQGKRALHKEYDDTYCCIGVLCEIAVAEEIIGKRTRHDGFTGYGTGHMGTAPDDVCAWAGITPRVDLPSGQSLTTVNDEGATFTEIADLIEKWL